MWTGVEHLMAYPSRAAVTGLVVVSLSGLGSRRPAPPDDDWVRRDCPHTWSNSFRQPSDTTQPLGRIAIAPLTSDIPEFHDCQRFIDSSGTRYLDLVAVFAHQTIAAQWERLVRLGTSPRPPSPPADTGVRNASQVNPGVVPESPLIITPANIDLSQATVVAGTAPPPGNSLVFAEILNYGGRYAPLGIEPGFNCLFLTDAESARAVMVPVAKDGACLEVANFDTLISSAKGTELVVRRRARPGYSIRDYPPVARWDWDMARNQHYVGIMCGAAWCEIGAAGFRSSPSYAGAFEGQAVPTPQRRVVEIKGWYDEQRLAVRGRDGALVPSPVRGTVYPHPRLGTYRDVDFKAKWTPVAYAVLTGSLSEYQEKLNLELSNLGKRTNSLFLCQGRMEDCIPRGVPRPTCPSHTGMTSIDRAEWWARIISSGGRVAYRCVTRWYAPPEAVAEGFRVPGTARWRWLASDETIWEACAGGCCQSEGGT